MCACTQTLCRFTQLTEDWFAGGHTENGASSEHYFEGRGNEPSVPKYLRFKGKVRNRRLPKREVEVCLHNHIS